MIPVWDRGAADWVAAHIEGCGRGFGKCRGLGVEHHGETVAGVVFHDWTPERGTVELSAAATDRRWLTRGVVNVAFGYAFSFARMAVTRTAESNEPVRRMWRAFGATEYEIADLWNEGEACVIFTLSMKQWRGSRLFRR